MKITITVEMDGSSLSRTYGNPSDNMDWQAAVDDMLDTLEKVKEVKF